MSEKNQSCLRKTRVRLWLKSCKNLGLIPALVISRLTVFSAYMYFVDFEHVRSLAPHFAALRNLVKNYTLIWNGN